MERLLILRLECSGCRVEALLNGVPIVTAAAAPGAAPAVRSAPVHEYTLEGANELELQVEPALPGAAPAPPEPRLADGRAWAHLRLLLPRSGTLAHPERARMLASIEWAPAATEVYEAPLVLRSRIALPIAFPRWRWLDVAPVPESPGLASAVAAYLLPLALGLARGDAEPLVLASRLRLEELALAYQRPLADEVGRLRRYVQTLHARQPLAPPLPSARTLLLRRIAAGRLVECLGADGRPWLRSPVAGGSVDFPLRLAQIEGRFYVLR